MDNDSVTQPLPEDFESPGKPKPWGKLISVNQIYENINLYNNSYSFGRSQENDIVIDDSRVSKVHFRLFLSEDGEHFVQDFSVNGTYIEDERLMKGEKRKINQGDKIFIFHYSKVPKPEVFGFVFAIYGKELYEIPTYKKKSYKNQKAWGKLSSFNMQLDPVDLFESSYTIGRDPTNDICIPHVALSKVHCKIYRNDKGEYLIEDFSTNGTFIEDDLIGKQAKKIVRSGQMIYLIHKKKVDVNHCFGFVFNELWEDSVLIKRKLEKIEEPSDVRENMPTLMKRLKFEHVANLKREFCEKVEYQEKIKIKHEVF